MRKQKLCASLLVFSMCVGLAPVSGIEAAKADVSLSKTSAKLTIREQGGKITYGTTKIKVKAAKGAKVKKVTYKSANSKVATVDKKGKVKAKNAGSSKIKVTVKYTKKKKTLKNTLTFKVTVEKSGDGKKATPGNDAGATSAPGNDAGATPTPGADAKATLTPEQAEAQKKWTALVEQGVIKMDGVDITECDKEYEGELVIPERDLEYKYNVLNIRGRAFAGCTKLTSVTIPSGVGYIAVTSSGMVVPEGRFPGVFNGCTGLTSVTLPDDMKTMPARMFYECSSLKTIKIPNGIERIFQDTFYGCSSLETIEIPNDLAIEQSAFYGCSSLTSITGADQLSVVEANAFNGCSSLKGSITVGSVGRDAFYDCTSLTSIIFTGDLIRNGMEDPRYMFWNVPLVIYDGDRTVDWTWGAKRVEKSDGTVLYPSES